MSDEHEMKIVIERVFEAPRDLVWKVWTEAEHVAQWWGPGGMETRVDGLDFRVGGSWSYVMLAPDGSEYPQSGIFSEIVPPAKIVTSAVFNYGPGMEQQAVMTYEFEDLGTQTKLTMTHLQAMAEEPSEEMVMGVTMGWNSNWDSLVAYLPTLAA
jgi:uncharacterized protein YndB with AHSA1/START domain